MPKFHTTPEAYALLHEGALALSEVEAHGVRVDKSYIDSTIESTGDQIKRNEDDMRNDPVYDKWRRRYGTKANLGSYDQLKGVMIQDYGFIPKEDNAIKRGDGEKDDMKSAGEASFAGFKLPFLTKWFDTKRLIKGRNTYLMGIQREMVCGTNGEWYIHPHYHLNTTITHRSSCSDPNFQNNPARNPFLMELIRRSYIPRHGNHLLELDYGQIEVRIPPAYNLDPVLMDYCKDPSKDMHRDMAQQIFFLKKNEVSKECRHISKNEFVFPTFYGSYYAQCAPNIWESIQERNIKVEGTGVPLIEHLRDNGIYRLGECNPDQDPADNTFEKHLKAIEDDFWGRRFKVYAQWKRTWWDEYQRNGGFRMLSGFAVNMPLDRKQVCNSPIQGVAFHCTLWSLIRINRCLRRYKFQTRVIGEIHDCINFDGPAKERNDVIDLSIKIMTEDIKKWAPWLNVPLVVEPEMCPINFSWFDKMALALRDGVWAPASVEKWESKYGSWDKQVVA